jgi:glycerol kinase
MIVGLTQYSTASHIARATLEAVCYQSRAVLDVIEQESGVRLDELKVDGKLIGEERCSRGVPADDDHVLQAV